MTSWKLPQAPLVLSFDFPSFMLGDSPRSFSISSPGWVGEQSLQKGEGRVQRQLSALGGLTQTAQMVSRGARKTWCSQALEKPPLFQQTQLQSGCFSSAERFGCLFSFMDSSLPRPHSPTSLPLPKPPSLIFFLARKAKLCGSEVWSMWVLHFLLCPKV